MSSQHWLVMEMVVFHRFLPFFVQKVKFSGDFIEFYIYFSIFLLFLLLLLFILFLLFGRGLTGLTQVCTLASQTGTYIMTYEDLKKRKVVGRGVRDRELLNSRSGPAGCARTHARTCWSTAHSLMPKQSLNAAQLFNLPLAKKFSLLLDVLVYCI